MSSCYNTVKLEAMRKARLKQELTDSIQMLREQLQTESENNTHVTQRSNIDIAVSLADDSAEGYCGEAVITGSMLENADSKSKTGRSELDFSSLLSAAGATHAKPESELDSLIKKVDERPIISEKDEEDRTRLLAGLAKIVHEPTMDIEDKLRLIKMRVSSYLQGAAVITKSDEEKIKSEYYEYCALCEMLDVKPTEKLPYRVKKEIVRMTSVLEKQKQDAYIMDVIGEIMEDLGCHVKSNATLNHTTGQMYAVDGHPLCDVFVGSDGNGIMFEPVGESRDGSLEKQRQIEESANYTCSLYEIVEERAAEKGVILKRVYIAPARISDMCVKSDISDISERSDTKSRRSGSNKKQEVLNSED